jgi:RND superfamily putative drug exporter
MKIRWIVPVILVVVWLGLGGYGGPTFGKLKSISSNDEATFLPQSAESTKVQDIQKLFVGEQTLPAIVLFESNDQIGQEATTKLAGLAVKLGTIPGVKPAAGQRELFS